jgi:hypothetical protein
MSRYLSAWIPYLVACSVYAQDEGASIPPAETVSVVWVALFGILFMGMIVGFFVYLWWKERHRKDGDQA